MTRILILNVSFSIQIIRQGFQGCILDIKILKEVYPEEIWTPLNWNESQFNELAFLNWQGCPSNLERDSYHFMGQGMLPNVYMKKILKQMVKQLISYI